MNYMSVANEGIDRPPTPTKAALALAIKRGDVTTSRSILLAETIPFDINAQGMDGGTLLMLAAEGGNAGVCGLLLQRGADVNILDSDGCSALWGAASYGHAGVCELLCRYGALVNAPCGPTDTPPLLEATFGGHLDACEILLQHGALVNLAGRNNVTPLTLAAEMGHVTVCELLLRYGADVNGCGLKLLPPLALISGMACYDSNNLIPTYSGNCVLSTLIQPTDMDGTYDLFQGSTNNITDAIVYRDVSTPASPFDASLGMTMRPPSISVASPAGGKAYRDGSSPLLLAASNGHLQCCQVLLKYGADVNRMNKRLYSPLHRACVEGRVDVCELLIAKGASMNTRNYRGCSALAHAATNGHDAVCELLLRSGADPNIASGTCANGCTPLMLAVAQRHVSTVKLMLSYKADANRTSARGDTALMFAASEGFAEICRVLIDAHVAQNTPVLDSSRVSCSNRSDSRSSSSSSSSGHVSVANDTANPMDVCNERVLDESIPISGDQLRWELDVDAQNENGLTALMLAAFRGREDICQMLLEYGANPDIVDKGGFSAIMLAAIALTSDHLPTAQRNTNHLVSSVDVHGPASNGELSSFGSSSAHFESQVLFPVIPMSAPSSPRCTPPCRTATGQGITGEGVAMGGETTGSAPGYFPPANALYSPATGSNSAFSGAQTLSVSSSLYGGTENVVRTRSVDELKRQISICKLLLRYGASVKLQNADEMDVIQVNRRRNISAFSGFGGCLVFSNPTVTHTNAAADPMNLMCIAFELEEMLVKARRQHERFIGLWLASTCSERISQVRNIDMASEDATDANDEDVCTGAHNNSQPSESVFGRPMRTMFSDSYPQPSRGNDQMNGTHLDGERDLIGMSVDVQLSPNHNSHQVTSAPSSSADGFRLVENSTVAPTIGGVSLASWPAKPSSNAKLKRSLYVSTGFDHSWSTATNNDYSWTDNDSSSELSVSPRSSHSVAGHSPRTSARMTSAPAPQSDRRERFEEVRPDAVKSDPLNMTTLSDASNASLPTSNEGVPPPAPATCYDSDDARLDPSLSPRSAMRRRLMLSSEASAEAETMLSGMHLASVTSSAAPSRGGTRPGSPRPFENDFFLIESSNNSFSSSWLSSGSPTMVTAPKVSPHMTSGHDSSAQGMFRPSSPRTSYGVTSANGEEWFNVNGPSGRVVHASSALSTRSMPALMSDVLAFRQQSLLQQQQQQQEELLQRYQPIRSIFHALDPLSVMATAERNRAHGIRNEDVVSRRMGDTSDHQSGDLHPFETAIINNSRTTQVLRTMRGSNVLHKLPSDIARLAISFL